MSPRVLTCAQCGGPLNLGAPFCAYCRAPLRWGQTIDLQPGEVLTHVAIASGPSTIGVPRPDGLHVPVARNQYSWRVVASHARNACVSLRGQALDDHGELGMFVRWNTEGTFRTGYNVRVYPALRSFCFERWMMGEKERISMPVLEWTYSPHVAPPGAINELEVRFADELFHFLINGVQAGTSLEATFGFGEIAWYAGSNDAPAELVLESLTVRRVL